MTSKYISPEMLTARLRLRDFLLSGQYISSCENFAAFLQTEKIVFELLSLVFKPRRIWLAWPVPTALDEF